MMLNGSVAESFGFCVAQSTNIWFCDQRDDQFRDWLRPAYHLYIFACAEELLSTVALGIYVVYGLRHSATTKGNVSHNLLRKVVLYNFKSFVCAECPILRLNDGFERVNSLGRH